MEAATIILFNIKSNTEWPPPKIPPRKPRTHKSLNKTVGINQHRGIDQDDQWFQQDGAIPYASVILLHNLAKGMISEETDELEVWRSVGTTFTGLEYPRFLSGGEVFQG